MVGSNSGSIRGINRWRGHGKAWCYAARGFSRWGGRPNGSGGVLVGLYSVSKNEKKKEKKEKEKKEKNKKKGGKKGIESKIR